jgi:cell division GTPase FtsZ
MINQQVQEFTTVQADPGQPLIGVIAEEQGREVVRYFTTEADADRVLVEDTTQAALVLAGVWSDLAWDELEQALDRIRHESPPTPPFSV